MKSCSLIRRLFIVLFAATLLFSGCGNQAADSSSSPTPAGEAEIEWGREITLDEMMAMANKNQIEEIQWHVLPNILRARCVDGSTYHLRNENKGVDLRSRLIEAGVRIGTDGLQFRHVF
jgi:hypothetical protein